MKKYLITILKFAISFAILGYLFHNAWQNKEFGRLAQSEKDWSRFALAFVIALTAIVLSVYRWYLLVRALELPIKLLDAFRLGFIGLLFTFFTLGVIGGDAVKAVFVAKHAPSHKTEAVTTVFIDRVFGLFSLFLITGVAYFFMSSPTGADDANWQIVRLTCQLSLLFAGLGTVGIVLLFTLPNLENSRLFRTLFAIRRIGPIFRRAVRAVMTYRSRGSVVVIALAMSIVIHGLLTICVFLVASGLSEIHPSLIDHFVIVPIANVANAVPLPGGLGAMDAALDFLYVSMSDGAISSGFGLIVTFCYRLITMIIATIGFVMYLAHRKQMQELISEAKAEGIA